MHSPVQDLVWSSFTVRELAGTRSAWTRLRAAAEELGERVAEWRLRVRTRNQLAQLNDRDWAVGDFSFARCQAETELRKPFWIN